MHLLWNLNRSVKNRWIISVLRRDCTEVHSWMETIGNCRLPVICCRYFSLWENKVFISKCSLPANVRLTVRSCHWTLQQD